MTWVDRLVFFLLAVLFLGVATWIGLKIGERP